MNDPLLDLLSTAIGIACLLGLVTVVCFRSSPRAVNAAAVLIASVLAMTMICAAAIGIGK